MNATNLAIARRFDRAAENYDEVASVQAQIAKHLVEKAIRHMPSSPATVLDIGCGTGFVAEAVAHRWPQAHITAIDQAPSMLAQAQRKIPDLQVIAGDIATAQFAPSFDLILSSMALHWLADPPAALIRWQKWLKPQGRLFVALLIEGSFQEWRDLCAASGIADSLWPFPRADFAKGLAAKTDLQEMSIAYASAENFLHRLKAIGACSPKPGAKPLATSLMRRLLDDAPQPFAVTYRVLYLGM
jgi:malonyl-CoA O-methyltransferase